MVKKLGKTLPKSDRTWRERIQIMIECCGEVTQSISGLDKRKFRINEYVISFYVVRVTRIGELAGSIPKNKQRLYPEVNWQSWKDARNALAHSEHPNDVDIDELWEICKYKIPKLLPLLRKILEESEDAEEVSG